jgi:hypothetical protein
VSKNGLKEFADFAYCACSVKAVEDRFSLLHEIGHIFGAGHGSNQKNEPGPALFQYSSGYHFVAGARYYTTVMGYPQNGYDEDVEWKRLPFFSSPLYTLVARDPVNGFVEDCGIQVGTAKNDNTRTLRNTFPWIANFRVASPCADFDRNEDDAKTEFDVDVIRDDCQIAAGDVISLQRFVGEKFMVVRRTSHDSPVTVKVSGLPSGLKFQKKTGVIVGMPKRSGTFSVTVIAKDREKHQAKKQFTLCVGDHPSWATGTFNGYTVVDGSPAFVKLKIYGASGLVKWSYKVNGKTRRFSVKGFEKCILSEGGVAKLGISDGVEISPAVFCDYLGDCTEIGMITGIGPSRLFQDVWSRKDLATCRYKKKFTYRMDSTNATGVIADDGYLDLVLSAKGKAKVSGKIAGCRFRSAAVMVRLGAATSSCTEKADVFVIVPGKECGSFNGISCKISVQMTVGEGNRITKTDVVGVSLLDSAYANQ